MLNKLSIKNKIGLLITGLLGFISIFIYAYYPSLYAKKVYSDLISSKSKINNITAECLRHAIKADNKIELDSLVSIILRNENQIKYLVIKSSEDSLIKQVNLQFAHQSDYKQLTDTTNLSYEVLLKTKRPLYINGAVKAYFFIGYDISQTTGEVNRSKLATAILSMIIFSFAVFSFLQISNLIFKPLENLSATAKKVSDGDLKIRADIPEGEIGELAKAFNKVLENVKKANDDLSNLNRNLEDAVEERTEQLKNEIERHKETVNDLIVAKEKADEMNKLKTNFLANISHELRTPLNGILGFSELLLHSNFNEEIRFMGENIHASGLRLLDTMNSLIDLSLLETNKIKLNLSEVDMYRVAGDVITNYKDTCRKKNIFIKLFSGVDNTIIKSDLEIIKNIVSHLISNAVKFTLAGGVTVYIDREPTAIENAIYLKVTDTGIGIPERYHDIIFSEFRQVSEGISRDFEGNGLGLTITKKYVDILNGNITLQSTPGVGTTFTIKLPIEFTPKQA